MRAFSRGILNQCSKQGTTVNSIETKELLKFKIPLFSSEVQTRIVAEIEKQFSRLDEAVANLKRVKANLKRYKAAVLKAAVKGKLTEGWRKQHPDVEPADNMLEQILAERRKAAGKGKYKEPVGPDTSGLPELPVGWAWASVEQLTSELMNGYGKRSQTEGHPRIVLRLADISNGEISFNDVRRINCTEDEISKYKLAKNDLLILRVNGSPDLVGRFVMVDQQLEEVLFCDHFIRARSSIPDLSGWLRIYSDVERFRKFIDLNKVSSAGQNTISQSTLAPFAIPVPPIAEKHQIVAEVERRLSIVAEAEAQVEANLRRADRLRQSILKQAFSCQLVPHAPDDEPASVLLERIRATQPARSKEQTTRQRKHRAPAPRTGAPAAEPLPLVAEAPATYGDAILARILAAMQPGREYARADLIEPLGLTTGQWNTAIQELKRQGKVRQAGEKRGARYLKIHSNIQP